MFSCCPVSAPCPWERDGGTFQELSRASPQLRVRGQCRYPPPGTSLIKPAHLLTSHVPATSPHHTRSPPTLFSAPFTAALEDDALPHPCSSAASLSHSPAPPSMAPHSNWDDQPPSRCIETCRWDLSSGSWWRWQRSGRDAESHNNLGWAESLSSSRRTREAPARR